MAETTCPVFRPTEKEFADFRRYMEEVIDPQARKAGLCKVIPPPGWAAKRRDAAEELCKSVYIPAPIRQCVSSTRSNGVYSVDVVENRPMSLADFKAYADKRAPFPSSTANAGFPGCPAGVRRGRSSGSPTHEGGLRDSGGGEEASGEHGGGGCGGGARGELGQESEVARRVRMFWRSLGPNSEAPIYGADTLGTLFAEDDDDSWNVGRLDTILQLLKANLPGITTSMLYAGMWRSMFAFHVEDVNLYSINYLHRGDPKSWYGIPPDSRQRFESLAQAFFTEEFRVCKDHLRHKTSMISPLQIQKAGIGFCTAVQEAGDFMITFPSAYHGGFNHGFNIAESTNFAIDRWIEEGRGAGYCRCSPHSVRIDVDRFETLVRQHRRIAGHVASCLDGLAEAPPPPRDTPQRESPGKGRSKKRQTPPMSSAVDFDANGKEDDEDDEDVQVFQCVCSTVRVLRRVRRTANGEYVPIGPPSFSRTGSHNGSISGSNGRASHSAGGGSGGAGMNGATLGWPEGKLSACPRCGVWGHTACLEFDATAFLTKGVKGASGATGECKKRGREGGKSSIAATPAAVPGGTAVETAVGGTMDLSDGAGAGEGGGMEGAEKSGVLAVSATSDLSSAYVDVNVDTNAGPAAGQEMEEEGVAAAASVIVAPVAKPPPICWMCMKEKAESAAAALAIATGGGDGGTSGGPAAPRRAGKVSGGSPNNGGGGGGGGTGGAAIVRGGRVAKRARKTGNGLSSDAAHSNGSSGSSFVGGDPNSAGNRSGGGGVINTVTMAAAVDPAIAVLHKRARVGPRLIGKEVLVSDGVAAVLTGVVSAIEAGQARIHYKGGRKAKLDEWIDVRSERFLSVAEAKKQMELARLAMNTTPVAAADPAAPGKQGKKRKADDRSNPKGNAKAGEVSGDREKKKIKGATEEGREAINTGKSKIGKGKGKAKDDTGREKKNGNKAVSNAGGTSAKSVEVLSKVGGKPRKGDSKGTGSPSNARDQSPKRKEKDPEVKGAKVAISSKMKYPEVKIAKVKTPTVSKSAKVVSPKEESKSSMQKEPSAVGKGKGKGSKGGRKTPEAGRKTVGKGVSKLGKGATPKPGKVGVGVGKSGSKLSKDKVNDSSGSSSGSKAAKNIAEDAPTTLSQGKPSAKKTKPPSITKMKGTTYSKKTPSTKKTKKGTVNADQATTAGDSGSKGGERSSKKAKKPRKGVDDAVAAGLRQAIARLARLPPEVGSGSAYSGTASAPTSSGATTASATAAPTSTTLGAAPNTSKEKAVAVKRDWRTAEYGFAGASWGLGPFFRGARRRPFASSASQEPLPPPNRAGNGTSDGTTDIDKVAVVDDEEKDWERDEEREAELMTKHLDLSWRFWPDRANVRQGETVSLGDDLAYREWLLRLREVQDIPIGHVERCAHQLAILLGSAPADGGVRASLRALLVAECLRGGAGAEVAAHVRRLASLIADAASRARPLPTPSPPRPQPSRAPSPPATMFAAGHVQGQRLLVPMSGGFVGWESPSKSRISGVASGLAAAHGDTIPGIAEGQVEVAGGKDGRGDCAHARGSMEDGDAPPPPRLMNFIRDSESAAAYTHALVYIARSKAKRAEAARIATDAENQDAARPTIVGKLPGAFPCSSSGDSSALHAKAMVGLKRTQRWAEAWLALPRGSSSQAPTVPEPLLAATVNETEAARKTFTQERSSSDSIVGEVRAADDAHGVARPESSDEERCGVDAAEAKRKVMIAPQLAASWTDGKAVAVVAPNETGGPAVEQERVAPVTETGDHSATPQPAAARSDIERARVANLAGDGFSRLEEADRQPPPSPVPQVSGSHINSDAATNVPATASVIDKASAEYQAGFAAAIGESHDKPPVGGYAWRINGSCVRTPPLWPPSAAALSALGFNLLLHPSMVCQQMSDRAAHSAAAHIAAQHAAAAAAAAATVAASGGGRTVPFGLCHPFWAEAAATAKVNTQAGQTNGAAFARIPSPSGGESARTRGAPAGVAIAPAPPKPVAATTEAAAAAASVGIQQFSGDCAVSVPSSLVGGSGALGAHVLASPAVALPAAGVAATSVTPATIVDTSGAVVGETGVAATRITSSLQQDARKEESMSVPAASQAVATAALSISAP